MSPASGFLSFQIEYVSWALSDTNYTSLTKKKCKLKGVRVNRGDILPG